FTLVAFGGAGALHAAELATSLGIRRVYVPPDPGLLSAWGVLTAEVVRDHSRTLRLLEPARGVLSRAYAALAREARARVRRARLPRAAVERLLDVRYVGQGYEITLPYRPGWRPAFHRAHRALYGHADPARPLEVVTLRLRLHGGREAVPRDRRPRRPSRRRVRTGRVVFESGPRR